MEFKEIFSLSMQLGHQVRITELKSSEVKLSLKLILAHLQTRKFHMSPHLDQLIHSGNETSCFDIAMSQPKSVDYCTSMNCDGKGGMYHVFCKGRHQNLTENRYLYSVKIELRTPSPLYLYSRISVCCPC